MEMEDGQDPNPDVNSKTVNSMGKTRSFCFARSRDASQTRKDAAWEMINITHSELVPLRLWEE